MSPDPTTIAIPAELKPADGRFGAGPSKVRPEQIAHAHHEVRVEAARRLVEQHELRGAEQSLCDGDAAAHAVREVA